MSNSVEKYDDKKVDVKEFPPVLRKLAQRFMENYTFRSIQQLCDSEGFNYQVVQNAISRMRKKGLEYNDLLYSLLDTRNKHRLGFVDNSVYQTALDGNMTGAKLFYQRTGAIDSGSGGDRNVIINQINIPIATNTSAPIDLIKTWQDRDKELDR